MEQRDEGGGKDKGMRGEGKTKGWGVRERQRDEG